MVGDPVYDDSPALSKNTMWYGKHSGQGTDVSGHAVLYILPMTALESVCMIIYPSLRTAWARVYIIASVSVFGLSITLVDFVAFLAAKPPPSVWHMGSTDPSVE